jgi:uncharacterized protein (TIGR03435 family)
MTKAAPTLFFVAGAIFLGENARGQMFEVASAKPSDPNARGSTINFPNGKFTATNTPARNLITIAYDVQPFQIEGAPNWVADQRFDVLAKMPDGVVKGEHDPNRLPVMRAALQALLADRFRLTIHRETKVMPAYVLVAAKGGAKLKETTDDGRGLSVNQDRGKLVAERLSMAMLARMLSGSLGSAVVDQTGIKGVFDLTLEWTPDEVQSPGKPAGEAAEPAVGPSIFTALQEQLGLKLEKQKAPVEMIVIDRIEKPTAN